MAAPSVTTWSPCLIAGTFPIGFTDKIVRAFHVVVADDLRRIGRTHLLKHPADNPSARLRVRVEG